jgi:integrase
MPSIKEKYLTLLTYELGLRISEALKLTWSDFNWSGWLLDRTKQGSVNLKNTKGGKFRSIPVPDYLMNELYEHHKQRNSFGIPIGGLLFDFGISEYSEKDKTLAENQYNYIVVHAEDRFRKLLYKVSNTVLGKKVNPHQLRHSKAQDLMNHGVPIETIKAFLGHSNISSTEIYASASSEKIRSDLEKYYKKDESKENS